MEIFVRKYDPSLDAGGAVRRSEALAPVLRLPSIVFCGLSLGGTVVAGCGEGILNGNGTRRQVITLFYTMQEKIFLLKTKTGLSLQVVGTSRCVRAPFLFVVLW